jgi:hypothetical protein
MPRQATTATHVKLPRPILARRVLDVSTKRLTLSPLYDDRPERRTALVLIRSNASTGEYTVNLELNCQEKYLYNITIMEYK